MRGIKRKKDHVVRILLNMRCKPIGDWGTASCSNHPRVKPLDRNNNNNNNVNDNNKNENNTSKIIITII